MLRDMGDSQMRWLALVIAIILVAPCASAEEPAAVTIPLKDIWAWDMPGTKPITELDPKAYGAGGQPPAADQRTSTFDESPAQQIIGALGESKRDQSGFAVFGSGTEALREARGVLVDEKQSKDSFPTDAEITLVFFSHPAVPNCRIDRVERRDDLIQIFYRLDPGIEQIIHVSTTHFALIPLGKLPAGKYRVETIQAPMSKELSIQGSKEVPPKQASRIVCKSFSFTVGK
jgi:hypothetical protein